MKWTFRILLPATWILSLAAAFMVGRIGFWQKNPPVGRELAGIRDTGNPWNEGARAGKSRTGEPLAAEEEAPVASGGPVEAAKEEAAAERTPDALEILEQALREEDPVKRLRGLLAALDNLTPENVEQVARMLENTPEAGYEGRLLGFLVGKWASFDPEGALAYAHDSGDERRGLWLTMSALRSWAETDHSAALDWVQGQELGERAGFYIPGIINGWAARDPQGATQYVLAMEDERLQRRAMEGIARELAGKPADAIVALLNQIPTDQDRTNLSAALASQMGRTNPELGVELFSLLDPQFSSQQALRNFVSSWAMTNPQEASDWVLKLPEGQAKATGIAQVVGQWAERNPVAAGEWLNQMPSSPDLDPAVANYASRVVRTDPAMALSWAQTITNPEMRNEVMVELASRWVVRDRESALQLMSAPDFPVEVREEVNRRLETEVDPRALRGGGQGGGGQGGPGRFTRPGG